jgi:hypothetical protein
MPFVPEDMTPSEQTLLASITAQTIAHRGAKTADELRAARSEAEQIAGEMIWAQRAETMPPEPEEPMDEELKAYYARLAEGAAANRAMYETDEPQSFDLPERKPEG